MTEFEQFIEAIKGEIAPANRVEHLIDMLQRLFALMPPDVTLGDLAIGWQLLAHPHNPQEDRSIAHRREICAKLSTVATRIAHTQGNLIASVKTWQAWQEASQQPNDPRLGAMASILARELTELRSASSGK
jgi:hypothetical protein